MKCFNLKNLYLKATEILILYSEIYRFYTAIYKVEYLVNNYETHVSYLLFIFYRNLLVKKVLINGVKEQDGAYLA